MAFEGRTEDGNEIEVQTYICIVNNFLSPICVIYIAQQYRTSGDAMTKAVVLWETVQQIKTK